MEEEEEKEARRVKVEIPDADVAVMYFAILQNLIQRPDLTDLERQALDFASCLIYRTVYGELPSEEGEVEIRMKESASASESESEEKEGVESVRSIHELVRVRNAEQEGAGR